MIRHDVIVKWAELEASWQVAENVVDTSGPKQCNKTFFVGLDADNKDHYIFLLKCRAE